MMDILAAVLNYDGSWNYNTHFRCFPSQYSTFSTWSLVWEVHRH